MTEKLFLWILFFCTIVLYPCMAAYDEYTPVFDVNDPYLVAPLSKETTKKINDMRKSFGEIGDVPLDKRNLNSHIIMAEQYFFVNSDGTVDFQETGDFYIVKQSGSDGVFFKRYLPFTKIADKTNIFYRDIRAETNKPYLFSQEKDDKGIVLTFKSQRTFFDEDMRLSGKYVIKAKIFNLIWEEDDHNRIDFVTSADDFSIPVDKLFVQASFAKTDTEIFRKEAFVMTGEMRRSEEASINDGKAVFRLGNRLLSEQIFTARIDFDKNIDSKTMYDLGKKIVTVKTAAVNKSANGTAKNKLNDNDNSAAVSQEDKIGKEGADTAAVAVFFAIAIFGYYYSVWRIADRRTGNILPTAARKAPENVSIAEATVLYKGTAFDIRECLALSMIDMAVKGFLVIDYDKNNNTVLFIRTDKPINDAVDEDERLLLDGFFKDHDAVEFPSDYGDDKTFLAYYRRLCSYRRKMLDGNSWAGKFGVGLIAFIAVALAMKFSVIYLATLLVGCVYVFFYRICFLLFKIDKSDSAFAPRLLIKCFGLIVCSSFFMGTIPYAVCVDGRSFSSFYYMIVITMMTFVIGTHLFFTSVMKKPKENAVKILATIKGYRGYMSSRREVVAASLYRKFLPYALLLGYEERLGITAAIPDFFVNNSHYDNSSLREIAEIIISGYQNG